MRQAGLPKIFIQLDDGKANEFAKSAGNGRFSGPTAAKNNNALHHHILMLAVFDAEDVLPVPSHLAPSPGRRHRIGAPCLRLRPGRIQDWLGHRSIQHTTRYTQLSAPNVQRLLEVGGFASRTLNAI
jgi:integrase